MACWPSPAASRSAASAFGPAVELAPGDDAVALDLARADRALAPRPPRRCRRSSSRSSPHPPSCSSPSLRAAPQADVPSGASKPVTVANRGRRRHMCGRAASTGVVCHVRCGLLPWPGRRGWRGGRKGPACVTPATASKPTRSASAAWPTAIGRPPRGSRVRRRSGAARCCGAGWPRAASSLPGGGCPTCTGRATCGSGRTCARSRCRRGRRRRRPGDEITAGCRGRRGHDARRPGDQRDRGRRTDRDRAHPWGADETVRINERQYAPIRKLIVHHTASDNRPANPAAVVRQTYRYHAVGRGFGDIGYNFLIDHRGGSTRVASPGDTRSVNRSPARTSTAGVSSALMRAR